MTKPVSFVTITLPAPLDGNGISPVIDSSDSASGVLVHDADSVEWGSVTEVGVCVELGDVLVDGDVVAGAKVVGGVVVCTTDEVVEAMVEVLERLVVVVAPPAVRPVPSETTGRYVGNSSSPIFALLPDPIMPLGPCPQHRTVRSSRTTHVATFPVAMATANRPTPSSTLPTVSGDSSSPMVLVFP